MRKFIAAALALLALAQPSFGQMAAECHYYVSDRDPTHWDDGTRLEWLEGSTPRGARLVFHNEHWRAAGYGLNPYVKLCEPCSSKSDRGNLRFRYGSLAEDELQRMRSEPGKSGISRAEAALQPEIAAIAAGKSGDLFQKYDFDSISEPQAVTVAGLPGLARSFRERSKHFTIAVVVVDQGCLQLLGLFNSRDGRPLAGDDLNFLNSDVSLEYYEAPPPPPDPPVLSPIETIRRDFELDSIGSDVRR